MGELQAIEKMLKKPLPVIGGAPWSADMVAAAPKPGQNRGQRPGGGGRQGQQMTKNPGQKPGKRPGRPLVRKPQGGQAAPQGGPCAKPQGAQPRRLTRCGQFEPDWPHRSGLS